MTHKPYAFPVWELIAVAWQKVKGSKGIFLGSAIIAALILSLGNVLAHQSRHLSHGLTHTMNFAMQIIGFLFQMSLMYMGIRRAKNAEIQLNQLFHTFNVHLFLRIIVAYLLQILLFLPSAILMLIGFILQSKAWDNAHSILSALGIFLIVAALILFIFTAVRLSLVFSYILDTELKPTTAIKYSFRATYGNVFKLIGAALLAIFINILGAIPLGIGLIWTMPFMLIFNGVVYAHLSNALAADMNSKTA